MVKGDAKATLDKADHVYDALYTSDPAYHAQIEPLNAIASVSDDGKSAEIWVGTQSQSTTIIGSAETLGTTIDKIKLHPIMMGGAYGRRGLVHADYVDDALLVSKAMKRPIKVIWSREDDVEAGTYRTAAAQYLRAAFDKEGKLTAVHHRVSCPDIIPNMNKHRWEVVKPKDVIAMMGSENRPYDIPNHLPEHIRQQRITRVNAWRGIATSYTRFAMESFLDELAHARKLDPMEFRLQLTHVDPRAKRLLEEVREMSQWSRPREQGVGLGIAVANYHHSLSVAAIELTVNANSGKININKLWAAGDCGQLVSPRNSDSQFRSNLIFGISQALKERITMENGVVQQSNYHDYPIIRMNEVPEIDSKLIETDHHPSGVGELGLAAVAPAIANAIFSITGKRIRHMPMTPEVVTAALKA
jgi:isoquinoline 1-oxidoreductase beta subunit